MYDTISSGRHYVQVDSPKKNYTDAWTYCHDTYDGATLAPVSSMEDIHAVGSINESKVSIKIR
jgi:hypothetical protein